MPEYYDEAGVPIRSRFSYGFIEPAHTPKVMQVDSEGRLVCHAFDLDITLSRAALAANVAQHMTQANYGYMYGFVDGGTLIPANTTNTLLNISGFGKLTFVSADIDNHTLIYTYITLDGEDTLGLLRQAAYLSYRKGSDSIPGLQAGWIDVIHWEALKYGIDYHVGKLGSFGTSALVKVQNVDAVNTHKAHIRANYFVSASKKFTITDPVEKDVAQVRTDLAAQLGIDPEGICTIYQENWDEEKQLNVPSLSAIVHRPLSKAGEGKVTQFLDNLRQSRKSLPEFAVKPQKKGTK